MLKEGQYLKYPWYGDLKRIILLNEGLLEAVRGFLCCLHISALFSVSTIATLKSTLSDYT